MGYIRAKDPMFIPSSNIRAMILMHSSKERVLLVYVFTVIAHLLDKRSHATVKVDDESGFKAITFTGDETT